MVWVDGEGKRGYEAGPATMTSRAVGGGRGTYGH